MDYDKLIEQLNAWNEQHLSVVCGGKHFACDYLCENEDCIVVRAATAIETLRADLARVTAERDAAVADIAAILAEVEEIRRGYGVDNADSDIALADLCGNYCAKCGNNCFEEVEDYRCQNFMWRGIEKED